MEFLRLARPGKNVTQLTDIARAAQGDLRQALIRLDFFAGSSRRAVTATDGRAPHALFDAQDALCDGKTVELDYSAMRWVQHNHLKVDCDIGIHATFAESMTGWDTLSTSQGGNDPEVRPDLLNLPPAIATMATHQLIGTKRGRFKLDNPADLESDFKRHKSDYPKGYDEQRVLKLCADPDRTAKPTASSAAHQMQVAPTADNSMAPGAPASAVVAADSGVSPPAAPASTSCSQALRAPAPAAVAGESNAGPACPSANRVGAASSGAPLHTSAADASDSGADAPSTVQIVYNGGPKFEVRTADVTHRPGASRRFLPGPACTNSAKSRVVVLAKCDGLGDFQAIVRTAGVLGCIVAEFEEGAHALVFKERNREFKACQECFCLCDGRVSHAVVEAACARFTSATHVRNVEVHKKGPGDGEEMPDFEDTCDMLKDTSVGDFGALHANALKARKYKRCTPLQEAILTYTGDIKDFMHAKEDAESMVFKTSSPGPHFLRDFKRETVLGLQGVHFESDGRIQTTTLRDAISKPQSATKPPLYLTKTFIFVGLAGGGKSEFMHALAREFCQRNGKTCYGFSASIDPYGLMTKSGKIKDLGCICLCDFVLASRLDHRLGREEVKGLLYTKERAHVPARYHQAIFHEWVPRMWSVNYGVDDRNAVDETEWFTSQGLPALATLLKRDAEAIANGGEHDKAIARRAVIFCVDENLFDQGAQGATDAIGLEVWQAQQANATPLD